MDRVCIEIAYTIIVSDVSKSGTVFGPEIIERSAVRADLLPGDAQGFVYAHVRLQNELVDVSSVTLPPNL